MSGTSAHSSVERVIAPDATIALDFMLRRMIYVLGNLCVYPENMKRNLAKSGGTVFSEKVLLALVDKGGRARHRLSHGAAPRLESRTRRRRFEARAACRTQKLAAIYPAQEIEAVWGVKHHLVNVDFIFRRVFH